MKCSVFLFKMDEKGNMGWFADNVIKVVGNRADTLFWLAPWVDRGLLIDRFSRLFSLAFDKNIKVAEL